jgi:hypothetical protein
MTNDELADAFKALFDELESKLEALPDSQRKTRAQKLTGSAHLALGIVRDLFADDGTIQPMSGGGDKP